MEDAIKKFLYAGVELASTASEQFSKSVTEMVDNNKITSEEGKEKIDEAWENTRSKIKEFENKFNGLAERFDMSKDHNDELEALRKKVAELEAKVSKGTKTKATA